MKVPCINCQNRKINCHSKCEEYKKFRKWKDEQNIIINNKKRQQAEYINMKINNANKSKRR